MIIVIKEDTKGLDTGSSRDVRPSGLVVQSLSTFPMYTLHHPSVLPNNKQVMDGVSSSSNLKCKRTTPPPSPPPKKKSPKLPIKTAEPKATTETQTL